VKRFFIFLAFLFLFLLPTSFVFTLWSGKKNLERTKTFLLTGDFEKAQASAQSSSHSFGRVKACLSFLPSLESFLQIEDWLEAGETLADAAFHLSKTGKSVEKIISVVLRGEDGDLKKITQEARTELDLVWEELSLLEGTLKKKPIVKIPQLREKIEIGREFLSILPEILPEGRHSYLFLLQNNMELRPTGGFIGSYGLAIFENGRLLDFQVEDVYTADGQLKGHVEPPVPIKNYLGEAGWYLRDSNFDPDYPKTARNARWFFQKETGRVVDGVVAVNFFVIQKILEAIGPVKLGDYQETITAENLFERAEYHSEAGFFPGSTQKRDFLANLARQLFQKISPTGEWLKIGEVLFESLEEKQILIAFDDEKAMRIFTKLNWDGRILENVQCSTTNIQCVPDYLMVVESNFGVNKVNYFLTRKLAHKIELGREIIEELTIDYKNNSPSQAWPGGNYKNYLRVYLPLGSRLSEAKIDEKILDPSKVDSSSASGKTTFGFLVDVPVGEEKEVGIKYKIPFRVDEVVFYSLLFQKQSGTGKDLLTVLINYPSSLKVTKTAPNALTGPEAILYNTDLSRDRVFTIELRQNEKAKT